MQFSLPKSALLRKKIEFDRVFKKGRFFRDALTSIVVAGSRQTESRIGIVATKKMGGAVVRNRLRRVFREAYRLLRPQIRGGFDLVVLPKIPQGKIKRQDAERSLISLFRRAGIWEEGAKNC